MPKEEIEARCQRASSNEHEVLLVGLCHFQNPKHENQRIYKPLASFARDCPVEFLGLDLPERVRKPSSDTVRGVYALTKTGAKLN